MKHVLKDNISLLIGRQFGVIGSDIYDIFLVSDCLVDYNVFRRGGTQVFPLFLYKTKNEEQKSTLFDEPDPFNGKERIENISGEFRSFIDMKYRYSYSPEEILSYIYAILHSPAYRKKYFQFLNYDFPRIPFVEDPNLFEELSKLGSELMRAHLLKDIPDMPKIEVSKNDEPVDLTVYDPRNQRIYANKNLFFSPVPKDVWNFQIGGYQVLDRYLKYRKGRNLTLDEKENIINIVKVLRFTIDQMIKIDEIWKP